VSARYAVYFAPEIHSPWWEFGSRWLGRDEHDNIPLPQPLLEDIPLPELAQITQEPRRYGFHATLKAPFQMAAGCKETDLVVRLGVLAQTLQPVSLSPMCVAALGNFIALVPREATVKQQALAAACVRELDDMRAPLTASDLARRDLKTLDEREAELLTLYGYPYVMERFRLHLTLTGPIESAVALRVTHAVSASVDRLNADAPLRLDRLCLFVERAPGLPFQRVADIVLQA
jgi:putative phosphonate metabolism protein